jgi:tRNA1(Val) A37 N6-methylase TrmN6
LQLADDERLDYLPISHLKIIQSHKVFSFSLDAVLLAQFAWLPLKRGKIMDLCTGNGAVPLLLSTRTQAFIDGVEIQERLADMAVRSVRLNGKEDRISIYQLDLKEAPLRFERHSYDVVTCNPPYLPVMGGQTNLNPHVAIARHELFCTLEDVLASASALLRPKGRVALVHRPGRLVDLFTLMRRYELEPKRMCLVYPKANKPPNMVLIEGLKQGQAELTLLPPLIVYGDDNRYTARMNRIYHGQETVGDV